MSDIEVDGVEYLPWTVFYILASRKMLSEMTDGSYVLTLWLCSAVTLAFDFLDNVTFLSKLIEVQFCTASVIAAQYRCTSCRTDDLEKEETPDSIKAE